LKQMHDVMFKSRFHMIHVPGEHDAALTQFNSIEYLCASHDALRTNHDRVLQIVT